MELTKEQVESLAGFVRDIMDEWPDVGIFDGGDIQDIAARHKILIPQIMHAPCGEFCNCAETVDDEEWQDGVTCYHVADWLERDAVEHPVEPTGAGLTVTENGPVDEELSSIAWKCNFCGRVNDDSREFCENCEAER